MLKKDYTLKNADGLTSRISSNIVSYANRFTCSITLSHESEEANLKSIMNVMALVIKNHDKFTITANGDDEEDAINFIDNYLSTQDIVE